MSLKLYLHPLSSYCHKVLIAFYENDIPFERVVVDQGNSAQFRKMWPIGKFPLLEDAGRKETVPESTIIIEYLARHFPGKVKLIPDDPDRAREVRMRDRFFDLYMHAPMQKVVGDKLRPADRRDPYGVEEARQRFLTALGMLEADIDGKTWIMGDDFTMADCAAAPTLTFGARFIAPFGESHPKCMAYLERLRARPSYARALDEAKPYWHMLPT